MSPPTLQTAGTTQVELTVTDGAAWITLNGPRTRNALDGDSAAALVAACERIDADPSVGVAVVTGAHGTFCSGAVRGFLAAPRGRAAHVGYDRLGAVYRAFDRVGRLNVPTIARIEGAAVGAGLNLALAADLLLAAEDARLISGFAPIGIHPGGGHLHLLARAAGRQTAAALGMFARPLTGAEAKASRSGVGRSAARRPRPGGRGCVCPAAGRPGAGPGDQGQPGPHDFFPRRLGRRDRGGTRPADVVADPAASTTGDEARTRTGRPT